MSPERKASLIAIALSILVVAALAAVFLRACVWYVTGSEVTVNAPLCHKLTARWDRVPGHVYDDFSPWAGFATTPRTWFCGFDRSHPGGLALAEVYCVDKDGTRGRTLWRAQP